MAPVEVHPAVTRDAKLRKGLLEYLEASCINVVTVAQMVVDLALPRWTWDIPVSPPPPPPLSLSPSHPDAEVRGWLAAHANDGWSAARDIATLDASGTQLVTRSVGGQSPAWARWTKLCLKQYLWPGDGVSFCFTIPESYSGGYPGHYTMHAEVADSEGKTDGVVFVGTPNGVSVQHRGTLSAVREHVLDDCGNVIGTEMATVDRPMGQLSQITMTRDDTSVRMRVDIGDRSCEFSLSLAGPGEIRIPAIRFYMYRNDNAVGWTIAAANSVAAAALPPSPPSLPLV